MNQFVSLPKGSYQAASTGKGKRCHLSHLSQKTWLSSIKYLGEKTEKYIFIIEKILSKYSAFDISLYEVSVYDLLR
jgi:hypothetical protein